MKDIMEVQSFSSCASYQASMQADGKPETYDPKESPMALSYLSYFASSQQLHTLSVKPDSPGVFIAPCAGNHGSANCNDTQLGL